MVLCTLMGLCCKAILVNLADSEGWPLWRHDRASWSYSRAGHVCKKKCYFYPTVLSEGSCTLLSYIVIVFKAKCTFCSRWFFSYSSVVTRWFLVQFWNKHSMVFPCVFVGKRSKMVRLRAKVCLHFRPKNAACNTLQNNCFVFVWAISVFG